MKLLDIMTSPWAITAPVFSQIIDIYNAHVRGPKIDFAAVEARLQEARAGRPMGRVRRELVGQITPEGVAVLDLEGPLAKRMSSVNAACEGTSTNLIADFFQQAVEDPQVKGIILNIDSPGGTVDGTMDLARAVFAARGRKPILALADGQACSAAYWIGAAADAFYLTNETSMAGSIGVVFTHVDASKALEKQGLVVTEITAGKYKRAVSQFKPLDEQGAAMLQEFADDIYTLFVNDISSFRGVPVEQVLDRMAEGRVFMGQKAIDVGLVDGVATLDDLIAQIASGTRAPRPGAGAALASSNPTSMKENPMDLKELREQHPELAKALVDEGRAEGRAEELARVKGCLDASKPGYESLALEKALDGQTAPGDAAMAVIAAEKTDLKAAKAKTEKGPDPLPSAGDPESIEAENRRKEAEAKAKTQTMTGPEWGARINTHIEQAKAEGRTLTAAQAAAELRKQDEEK